MDCIYATIPPPSTVATRSATIVADPFSCNTFFINSPVVRIVEHTLKFFGNFSKKSGAYMRIIALNTWQM